MDNETVTITLTCCDADAAAYLMAANAVFWYGHDEDVDKVPFIVSRIPNALAYLLQQFDDMVTDNGTILGMVDLKDYEKTWMTHWTGRKFGK